MIIPSIETIRDQILTSAETKLNQKIPRIFRGFATVSATAVAGVVALTWRYVAWALDQTQPATCNEFWLAIWGSRYNVPREPAVATVLQLDVTGTSGTAIDAGTVWLSPSGLVYRQLADAEVVSGSATVQVRCLTSGAIGAQADGATLSLDSPLGGVNPDATVDSTVTEGVDLQGVEDWRAAILSRIAAPPQGSAIADYVKWCLEVSGIVKVIVKPGAGDVSVYPLIATTGTGRVPGSPKLTEVQDYLRDLIRKPLGATPYALASTERTCAVTISGATISGAALTTAQRANVQAAVDASLYAAYPRQYPNDIDPTDVVSTSLVWSALTAYGATATEVTINVSGIGGGPYTLQLGEIIKPAGSITWA